MAKHTPTSQGKLSPGNPSRSWAGYFLDIACPILDGALRTVLLGAETLAGLGLRSALLVRTSPERAVLVFHDASVLLAHTQGNLFALSPDVFSLPGVEILPKEGRLMLPATQKGRIGTVLSFPADGTPAEGVSTVWARLLDASVAEALNQPAHVLVDRPEQPGRFPAWKSHDGRDVDAYPALRPALRGAIARLRPHLLAIMPDHSTLTLGTDAEGLTAVLDGPHTQIQLLDPAVATLSAALDPVWPRPARRVRLWTMPNLASDPPTLTETGVVFPIPTLSAHAWLALAAQTS